MRYFPWIALLGAISLGCAGVIGGEPAKVDLEDTGAPPEEDTGTPDPGDDSAPPGDDTGTPPEDGAVDTDPGTSGMVLAKGLAITEVAVFQAVKVSIAKDGAKVSTRTAEVIAGREALVRVYVTPGAGWSAHAVTGELRISSGGGAPAVYTATLSPSSASSDGALGSTFNFNVPTGGIAPGAQYSVSLLVPASDPGTGDDGAARYPAGSGTESFDARSTGETLKIKIVPIRYNADGSGRLPDTSAAQVEAYRRAFYGMYPAKNVEVTVRAPYDLSTPISYNGSGFSNALMAMVNLRASDGAPKDVYYYGAFAAASSFSAFCPGGCVTGLCGLGTSPSDASVRACVGIGFSGDTSAGTAAHEVGHAHGRNHAPCGGASGVDPSFPYSGGAIGPYGYDLVGKALKSPSTFRDMMGYCQPTWISDYNFHALATRMAYVNGAASLSFPTGAPTHYRMVSVAPDGALAWGEKITLAEPPIGDLKTVVWEGSDGKPMGTATGHYYPYDHLGGGYLLVPEAPTGSIAMRLDGLFSPASRLVR